ncbi:hypothetical protein MLP_08380 [Microlunatus phosphovorus NM-1]|uniref:DUF1508 domain-containing protein n=1 Tax=Microlunatus phosphovorus (strain ATCC 700054 / DSM 10555 / JCM 9379 / NBRC 101784 / NCIMB 13414 / VKM Ac-1990 / NM-1) TaxID=1032480 RepID=F5XLX3_MICPN|nr:DUF1508 domain-containing protein [Microlunatus phosphovorus]BAK33852.1 hypothetical protein MLP_08380 [Microlunatus phosphovorus NM-1]
MAGQFEIYKDGAGQFRWRLKMANGEVVANSDECFPEATMAGLKAEVVQDAATGAKLVFPPDD